MFGAAAAVAAAASLYLPVATGLAKQWFEDPAAAYGFFVALAALVAARQRWGRVRSLPLAGSWWGAAALTAAALLFAVGTLAADVFLLRVSAVACGASALWLLCGAAHVRVLAAPIVLCLAAIPLPGAVVTEMTLPLQLAASQGAALSLGALGFDVVREGNLLTMQHVTLEVAEACSGMRSIVTLGALVLVYWATMRASAWRVALLLAATIPVALAANSLRVVATALLALEIGEDATRGLVHDATGFVAFLLMSAALVAVHAMTSRGRPRGAAA